MKRIPCQGRGCVHNTKYIISEIGCYDTERRDCPRVPWSARLPFPNLASVTFKAPVARMPRCTDRMVTKMGIEMNHAKLLTIDREGAL